MTATTETTQLPPGAEPAAQLADPDAIPFVCGEDYTGEEFRIQYAYIIQTVDQQQETGGKLGQIHNPITKENHDALDCIVVDVRKNRWWGPSFQEAQAIKEKGGEVHPYCKSSNGNLPDVEDLKLIGAAAKAPKCNICPHGGPRKVEGGGGWESGECTDIRKLLLYIPKDGVFLLFAIRNKACKAVDDTFGPMKQAKVNFFTFRQTITTVAEKGKLNTYFLPKFQVHRDQVVPRETQREMAAAIAAYSESFKARSADSGKEDPNGGTAHTGAQADGYAGGPTLDAQVMPPSPPPPPKEIPADTDLGF